MDEVKKVDTEYNNAVAIFNRANELLNENGIKDSTGSEIARLEMSPANPAWIFALACGSLHTSWQRQLAKAYAAMDPQSCEDDQVLVLAALAGIKRMDGTPSHITVRVTNKDGSDAEVPVGSVFTESVTNGRWAINRALSLKPAGEVGDSMISTLYSAGTGALEVPEGTSFESESGLSVSVESVSASAGGSDIEPLSSMRNRLMQGTEQLDQRIQAMNAISSLSGIETCTIWFNPGLGTMSVGKKSIPGRTAYISVKGVDVTNGLADTYFTYMNVPAIVGEQRSECLIGQQFMSVNFDYASERKVDVFITISAADIVAGTKSAIKSIVAEHSGTLGCGESLTAQTVSEWVSNSGYATVIGCNVGTSSGIMAAVEPDEYCVFDEESIHVVEVGGSDPDTPPDEPSDEPTDEPPEPPAEEEDPMVKALRDIPEPDPEGRSNITDVWSKLLALYAERERFAEWFSEDDLEDITSMFSAPYNDFEPLPEGSGNNYELIERTKSWLWSAVKKVGAGNWSALYDYAYAYGNIDHGE